MVGPARWLKTPSTVEHQKNTLLKSPSIFLDTPDDYNTPATQELIDYERKGIKAVFNGDRENALMAGGECAQRVNDLPKVQDLVDRIIKEAKDILKNAGQYVMA
jgi:enoyl-[acyl-carrier protein] reductase II